MGTRAKNETAKSVELSKTVELPTDVVTTIRLGEQLHEDVQLLVKMRVGWTISEVIRAALLSGMSANLPMFRKLNKLRAEQEVA